MQLSPLQSRLAASLGASLVIFALYLLLFSPSFASATELPIDIVRFDESPEGSRPLEITYEPAFSAFDRSIIGRAPSGVSTLTNNGPAASNVDPGKIVCYMIEKSTLSSRALASETDDDDDQASNQREGDGHQLARRATSKTVYISANTCLQPSVSKDKSGNAQQAPQLSLYVSNSSDITCPSTAEELSKMTLVEFNEGAVMYNLNTTKDIFFGISAPNITSKYNDTYNFEIAVSLDEYYHQYDNQTSSQLLWMDSDSSSVLLVTRNLTDSESESQQLLHQQLPYDIFIQNNKSDTISGMKHSYCGLKKKAELWGTSTGTGKGLSQISMGFTTRGPGGLAKQQFYLEGLNPSSSYSGILVQTRNTTGDFSSKSKRATSVGGGGIVFQATTFKTSSATNCKVVTNLEFCNDIQYAVPGNDQKYNSSTLAKTYDDYAKSMYANFEKALMQIPCEVPPQSKYSLVRSCDSCKTAYKRWLCTVSIPRCEDFMSSEDTSIYRNVAQAFPNGTKLSESLRTQLGQTPGFNASRNSWIDETIQPGPYKELLPCEDVCYELVQACPASLGFSCPRPDYPSFNVSYGQRDQRSRNFTCNYPGEARTQNSPAATLMPGVLILAVLPVAIWLGL